MSSPEVTIPETDQQSKTRKYPLYKVFVHNDDATPYNVVISVLIKVFAKQPAQAKAITMEAHKTGVAFVTALTLEQAEFRVEQAHAIARANGFPLTFTYEPE